MRKRSLFLACLACLVCACLFPSLSNAGTTVPPRPSNAIDLSGTTIDFGLSDYDCENGGFGYNECSPTIKLASGGRINEFIRHPHSGASVSRESLSGADLSNVCKGVSFDNQMDCLNTPIRNGSWISKDGSLGHIMLDYAFKIDSSSAGTAFAVTNLEIVINEGRASLYGDESSRFSPITTVAASEALREKGIPHPYLCTVDDPKHVQMQGNDVYCQMRIPLSSTPVVQNRSRVLMTDYMAPTANVQSSSIGSDVYDLAQLYSGKIHANYDEFLYSGFMQRTSSSNWADGVDELMNFVPTGVGYYLLDVKVKGGGGSVDPPKSCQELGNCPVVIPPRCNEPGGEPCPVDAPKTCQELGNCSVEVPKTCDQLGNCPVPPSCDLKGTCPDPFMPPVVKDPKTPKIKTPKCKKNCKPQKFNIRLSADLLFDFDKSVIKPKGRKELARFGHKMKKVKVLNLAVSGNASYEGHPDKEAYNRRLSASRAKAVEKYLSRYVPKRLRVKVSANGTRRPVATNTTEQGRKKNRNVQISGSFR